LACAGRCTDVLRGGGVDGALSRFLPWLRGLLSAVPRPGGAPSAAGWGRRAHSVRRTPDQVYCLMEAALF
jgi:hypothetical protein